MKAIILAAGKGTRMKSKKPKVLQTVMGRPMLDFVLETIKALGVRKPVVVIGSGAEQVRDYLKSKVSKNFSPEAVIQKDQKGTGHAVMMAEKVFKNSTDDVLIWPGDMPLLTEQTMKSFFKAHKSAKALVSVLSSIHKQPAGYGRVLREAGNFHAIREELDAAPWERDVKEVNTGIYLFKNQALKSALKKIRPANKKKEYYLTDTIEILAGEGKYLEAFALADEKEALGINSRAHLSDAVKAFQDRVISGLQESGVTIVSPDQTFIEPGVRVGQDTVIYPWTYIESGVKIGAGCKIGPFAKIRSGSEIGDGSVVGSFVEVCRTKIGRGVLAKHLSYLGDAVIGDGTNIGAGAITANFDGKDKHRTKLGKKVLVGSNTVFVAPVSIGDRAKTGAGSVVKAKTRVQKGELVAGVPAKVIKKRK